jgi:hypothetical protein
MIGVTRKLPLLVLLSLLFALAQASVAQSEYHVVSVTNGGTIKGSVTWSGPVPRPVVLAVTKDPQICDPESLKTRDLERLILGPQHGVANTVVYLKNISSGKAMELPEPRRFLDQKHCRYEPHILLVPQGALLQMKSSDATLHTIHMQGAATYNLPFPFTNQVISRTMPTSGIVDLKCNGGHLWMNAEMFVVPHPYYNVTDESGSFELTDVPPGEYEIVAWHEGWNVARKESTMDVLTQQRVQRPVFSEPRIWAKQVSVSANKTSAVSFIIGDK